MSGRSMSIGDIGACYGRQSLAESVAAVRQQVESGGIQSPSIKVLLAYTDLILADEAGWKRRAMRAEATLREAALDFDMLAAGLHHRNDTVGFRLADSYANKCRTALAAPTEPEGAA